MSEHLIDKTVAQLWANEELTEMVVQTADLCQRCDGRKRLQLLWQLCAVGYTLGRADAIQELLEEAQANPREKP